MNVEGERVRALLIEDNPGDARLVQEALSRVPGVRVELERVPRVAEGIERLQKRTTDVVLLDLTLPDSRGIDTFARVHDRARDVPIVVLTGSEDEALAIDALSRGAQDYLVKGEVDGDTLARTIRYAVGRQRAEWRLQEAEQHYRSLFDHSPDPVFTLDLEGRIMEANPACARVLGHDPATLVGAPLAPLVRPEDRKRVQARFAEAARGAPQRFEATAVGPDGHPVELAITGVPLVVEGRVKGVFTIAKDVTEQRRAEAQLEARAKQQAAVAALGQDALRGLEPADLFNRAVARVAETLGVEYCHVLERQPGDGSLLMRAGVGWQAGHMGRASLGPGGASPAGFAVDTNAPVVVEDLRAEDRFRAPPLLRDHGVVSSASVLIHGNGHPFGVLGAHTLVRRRFTEDDVNFLQAVANVLATAIARKGSEEAVRSHSDELERVVAERTRALRAANAELESFSFSVSHDLREPLRAMEYLSQALQEDYADRLDAEGRDYLGRIGGSARKMAQLIEDLLRLSRVGRGEVERRAVELSAMALDVCAALRSRDAHREVDVVVQEGLHAEGDGRLVRVVLENLLGNAWKYTSRTARPRIEFGARDEGGERVFFVRDNGAGFDPARADRLFQPFQRLHTRSEFEGTGVGLATVERIVRRHGGRVWAEGQVGRGATFFFTLEAPPAEGASVPKGP